METAGGPSPRRSALSGGVARVALGSNHICYRSTGKPIACWGTNRQGQLGDGSGAENRFKPFMTVLDSGATLLAAGTSKTCAIANWGPGLVGDGSPEHRFVPTPLKW